MQLDFHYYATYCAACIAGYTPEESLQIAYSAQFVDCCSVTLLRKTGGPLSADKGQEAHLRMTGQVMIQKKPVIVREKFSESFRKAW